MAQIKNCVQCGRLFMYNGARKICPDCVAQEQEYERIVADFVRDNHQANVKQIVDGTGVNEKIIMRMIREGRFVASEYPISYPCESCGKMITHAKYCRDCSKNFMDQMAKMEAARSAIKTDRSHSMAMLKDK